MDIADTLRKLGHEVTDTVPSGEQAIASVNGNKPDLIFMDIGLKGAMDGIETAAQIRAQFSIPVIFLTAFVDEKTLDRAKETLPAGYLTKPFEENDLASLLKSAFTAPNWKKKGKAAPGTAGSLVQNQDTKRVDSHLRLV